MMTATTPNRGWPLPNNGSLTGNINLVDDIGNLIDAFLAADVDVQSVISGLAGRAPVDSPAFTGTPTAPTAPSGDDSSVLANTAFVTAAISIAIANLVASSPATLDTLNELAAALGDDPNFAATMATQLGLKADSADVYLKSAVDALLAAKADGADTQDVASRGILSGLRNKLLNGTAQIIQGGGATIAAGSSAYVFDRWLVTNNTNQSVTVSQNQLALGAGFGPGGERYTMRYAFALAPTMGTLRIEQRIENVTSIKPGDWTLTSWMTGPSGTEAVAAEIIQNFGTGGSPSSPVTTAMTFAGSSPTYVYDASTNRRCWGVAVPALSGKLLGTAGNDYLAVAMVLSPRQAGNYDISWSSFVKGDASNELDPQSPLQEQQQQALCERYYQKFYIPQVYMNGLSGGGIYMGYALPTTMRAIPTLSVLTSPIYGYSTTGGTVSLSSFTVSSLPSSRNAFYVAASSGGSLAGWASGGSISANAEL